MFPTIKTIHDVLPAITDRDEFICANKGDYTVVNYVVVKPDTFDLSDEHALMRRECRGLIFDKKGKLISRPVHKFFNINEREETQVNNVNLRPHVVLDKLDGSMVRPIFFEEVNSFRLGTKMGITDTSMQAECYVGANMHYLKFFRECYDLGYTPVFEWCSPNNRIVVKYDKADLVLIALREMESGNYVPYDKMCEIAKTTNVSVVNAYDRVTDILDFIYRVQNEAGIEGYILRFDDGQMLKFKCEDYILLHKSKEIAQNPRHLVAAIIEERVDDLKALLQPDDLERLNRIEKSFWRRMDELKLQIEHMYLTNRRRYVDKKSFALASKDMNAFDRNAMFKLWDGHNALDYVLFYVQGHLHKDKSYRDLILELEFENSLFSPDNVT
jgi:RNA ligase